MTQRREHIIVVGVDGSPTSLAALVVALKESILRDCTVEVVTVWGTRRRQPPARASRLVGTPERRARQAQARAVRRALTLVPDAPAISTDVVEGDPADVLTRAAAGTAGLVVGQRRRRRAPAGTEEPVWARCMRGSTGPVILVPRQRQHR